MLTNNSPKYVGNKTQRWQNRPPPHYAPVQQERLSHTGWFYLKKKIKLVVDNVFDGLLFQKKS